MAKKVTTTKGDESSAKKGFSFAEFDKKLSKISGFELGSIIETNTFSEVDEWINTGSYLMNAQISGSMFGGIPNSRSVGFVGDPETGKTYVCLNICREAQKVGYDIVYCETEAAIDRQTVSKLGCDTNRFRYQPIKTVNDFKRFVVQVIAMVAEARKAGEKPKIMIVLDSLGMLTTEKDVNDAISGKDAMDMGIKAKQMRAMFRLITLDLAANKIPLIVTNHTTIGNIGSYTGPTKESAGGDGPVFSLSTVLMMSKKFQVEDSNKSIKTGIIINTRPKKSRSTIPTTVSMHVSFITGMNPFVGLEAYVNWEACGVDRGKIYTAKEYEKEGLKNGYPFQHTFDDVDTDTGEIKKTVVQDLVFVQKDTGRWCVKHFGKSLQNGSMLFNKNVFTPEVLKNLDELVIQPSFKLPDHIEGEEEINFEEDMENLEA